MDSVSVFGIVILIALALLIPLLAIAAPIIIVMIIVRAVSGSSQRNRVDAQETRMIQEIHHSLAAMERRIDSLEIIVVERKRATEQSESKTSVCDRGAGSRV
jgi:hypothetical protein